MTHFKLEPLKNNPSYVSANNNIADIIIWLHKSAHQSWSQRVSTLNNHLLPEIIYNAPPRGVRNYYDVCIWRQAQLPDVCLCAACMVPKTACYNPSV